MTLKLAIPILFVIALVCFMLGVIVNDLPGLTLSKELQLGSVLGSLITGAVTLSIAFVIPYLITKRLDDSKGIKQFLIAEVGNYCSELGKVRNKLEVCYQSQSFSNEDKKQINMQLDYLDKKVGSLAEQLNFSYPNSSSSDIQQLKDANADFWKKLTGGEFMDKNFVQITPQFWKESFGAFCECESKIKMLAHHISKY